jgi:hypothetical protein
MEPVIEFVKKLEELVKIEIGKLVG